jgi:hypothetical protein
MTRLEVTLLSLLLVLCASVFAAPWGQMHAAIDGYAPEVAIADREPSPPSYTEASGGTTSVVGDGWRAANP